MRRIISHLFLLLAIACSVVFISCGQKQTITGGTSTSENAHVTGIIVDSTGAPAPYAIVQLIPALYNPMTDSLSDNIKTDTTDIAGHYSFDSISAGKYNIAAVHHSSGMRSLNQTLTVTSNIIYDHIDTLQKTGTLRITLPDTVKDVKSYVYIPGTTIAVSANSATSENGTLILTVDSVPAAVIQNIYYVKNPGITPPQPIGSNINVQPSDTVTIGYSEWTYHKLLYLNTSSTGAEISETVTAFPVLIRLTNDNFNFRQSSGRGKDIRFTKADNTTPLPYEIDVWDSANGYAALWVKLDTIYPHSTQQFFRMHWGHTGSSTIDLSNSSAVFDTLAGFVGVWHMNLAQNYILTDATAHHYNATPKGFVKTIATNAIAGNTQQFDGFTTHFELEHTSNSALNFPLNGTYTISAWVYTDSLNNAYHTIFSKGNMQYALQINKNNIVEFFEFQANIGWNITLHQCGTKNLVLRYRHPEQ